MLIKFKIRKGTPMVNVTLNGRGGRMLIDSGANSSYVDKGLRKKYKFKIYELEEEMHGAGGTLPMYKVVNAEIETEQGVLDLDLKAIDFKHFSAVGIIGIIGSDFLIKNKLILDYNSNTLYNEAGGVFCLN